MEPRRYRKPMPLPPGVMEIYRAFRKAGKQLVVAGGAVRDHLSGIKPKDYDLATNATPDEVKEILSKNDIPRTGEVGDQFGVIIAKPNSKEIKRTGTITPSDTSVPLMPDPEEGYEIATFRIDE